ncbi:MAG: ribosome maturation factor RimM [Acidimicrobiia bacterium]
MRACGSASTSSTEATESEPPLLEVGRIVRAHGIRGEVIVEAVSNRPERFAPGSVLRAGDRELVVERASLHGGPAPAGRARERGRWIVAFGGVATRNDAEALRSQVLCGPPEEDGDDGELWVHELVGTSVLDTAGTALGRVVAVEANPASDLLVLDGGGLVPLVFVVEAPPGGPIVVDPPAGLFDL